MEHLHVASQRSRLAIAASTVVALIAALILVISPSRSLAAEPGDQIYWSREAGSDSIRFGPLTGENPSPPPFLAQTLFDDPGRPCGIAANPAAGKIYWASWDTGEIWVANLDGTPGSASTLFSESGHNLCGVAVDPAEEKIYWADFTADTIRVGNLDGTGDGLNGEPLTLFQELDGSDPSGVAIDTDAEKIYWTNQHHHQVRVGNLDGSDSASTLFGIDGPLGKSENNPIGVAIDTDADRLYWTDLGSGLVRSGNLEGTEAKTLFSGESPSGPAIDPTTNKIYWTSWTSGLGIRVGNLDGTGTVSTLFGGEGASLFAALVKAPVATALPEISEASGELSCSDGGWASDLLGAFLYRAPASFAYQWKLNGLPITPDPGSTPTFSPTVAGNYTCTVTATNHAGSTSQTSDAFTISPELTPELTDLDDTRVWVGLKNSDDQGTRFDVQVELLENGSVVATGVSRCVTGVTRNANQAKEVVVPWDSFGGVTLDTGDVLALRVSTRIGTNSNNTKCTPSHNNAVGLRLYYDSTTRASSFGATITPNPSDNEYLHSNGGACTNTESAGVTTRYFDETAPLSTTAKCKDSTSINFNGGNPWKVIGTWSRAPQA